MQDTDEGTYFGDVQTASVKRHLAKDSNNEKLYNASMMEMIGHLSKDNKETYLKHAQPLQKYIDAKDEFDFKHNNYTTTENVDKTPDEKVRQLQRELNEAGYTDKFGQKLKEDGIYAGKTAYAGDNYKADNLSQRFGNRTNLPSRGQIVKSVNTPDTSYFKKPENLGFFDGVKNVVNNVKDAADSVVNTVKDIHRELTVPLSYYGVLSPGDENKSKLKQTMIKGLSAIWHKNDNDDIREKAKLQASRLRTFDDNSFNRAIYLNSSDAAAGKGHSAVMLINKDDYAIVFSFYPQHEELPEAFLTFAEVRFAVLEPDEMNNVLYGDGKIPNMVASDGEIKEERYDRHLYYDITNGEGYNMYYKAVSIFDVPKHYMLVGRQCNDIATDILAEGGIDVDWNIIPNNSFENEKAERN